MRVFGTVVAVVLVLVLAFPGFGQEPSERIDINKATAEQLTTIKGIGDKTAAGILEYRNKVGRIERMSQLTSVYRVGVKTVALLSCRFMVPEEGPLPCGVVQEPDKKKSTPAVMADGAVNINLATEEELTGIKGIGPKKAEAIVAFRRDNGFFLSVDDLGKVQGFGVKTVERFRPFMAVYVNVNKATAGQLQALGFVNADKIVEFRDMFKGFKSLEDIASVPGTDKGMLERVGPLLLLK